MSVLAPLSRPETEPSAEPLVEAKGVSIRYDGVEVLRDVDLSLRAGEIVTLVGPNGSGKTSLARALAGALKPAAGAVRRRKGLRVGYVPQSLALDRTLPMTVDRFLALAGERDGAVREAALARTGATGLSRRQLSELSGGQFQRALLAHALLRRPELLVLDEPTTGLDQPGASAFYRLVAELRDELGCAVLMVSHDLHVVMAASDRVICLNGHVCCEGTPTVVAAAPEYRALFGYGTGGALALYRHDHDHHHDHAHGHGHGHDHAHDHPHDPAPTAVGEGAAR
ncbi:metal ABC transporter ATP-binding protein [Albimonas sp. CAU 1670]|uniref:metal ABC transporter ATP-binding protein n=1 Tax=Albimonas sp. CAU 1670 TaxID=3032599 RepID=UPI0023DAF7C7|nr:metal ABC transporter ATP-binding protein [Albimonas sp. CAU 1670]MDF2231966.1 metal ABC transporter ATP-binding protein [Albimonas sp. CAU 1670]